MASFKVGALISYPLYGAGFIEAIEEKEIMDSLRHYYVLHFSGSQMRVLVPVDTAQEAGLRDIIEEGIVGEVIEELKSDAVAADVQNWNKRFRENQDRLKTGDIFEVAGVVRTLVHRMKERGLSSGEKRMMNQALNILVSELAMASGADAASLKETIVDEIVV